MRWASRAGVLNKQGAHIGRFLFVYFPPFYPCRVVVGRAAPFIFLHRLPALRGMLKRTSVGHIPIALVMAKERDSLWQVSAAFSDNTHSYTRP